MKVGTTSYSVPGMYILWNILLLWMVPLIFIIISVVYPELRKAETYLQIFDALENLDRTATEIFEKIITRVLMIEN